jgi:Uma2 family endonuclease
MSDLAHDTALMSAEDYLLAENDGAWRHEFVNGAVYAMVGSSDQHNIISGNLHAALHQRLPEGCQVFMSDMKLRVRSEWEDRFYYPDVFVSCAPSDRERYTREEPVFVAEIPSPHTQRIDRGEKLEAYKNVASLQEYAILSQDRVRLEMFRRRTGWQRELFGLASNVTLESVGLTLPLITLYRRTDLHQPE